MRDFFDGNVLLNSRFAQALYDEVKDLPIIDYHCHLNQADIANDKRFENIGELWLAGDHYKWRAMRLCGIDEQYITGNACWKDKFCSYAKIMPKLLGNPLYYWTHFELKNIFDIDKPLNEDTANEIYATANEKLKNISVQKLLNKFNVEFIATTDDPVDDLNMHGTYNGVCVAPTFRPDRLYGFEEEYIEKLGKSTGCDISTFGGFQNAIRARLDHFVKKGCKISDHGFFDFPKNIATDEEARALYENRQTLSTDGKELLFGWLLKFLMREYKKRDIVMQLHFSVVRNVNTPMFEQCGTDCGFDVMGKEADLSALTAFLDCLPDSERPIIILYALNPNAITALATLCGAFRNIYVGAAWWFNDTVSGIKNNLEKVAEYACLGTNLGMLTDSRSFTSYVRFDFFRRILCDYVGDKVERGEYCLNDAKLLVKNISYGNIKNLLNIR